MPRQKEMLGVYLFRKLGYRKGTKAAAFIVAWGIYADSLSEGEVPTMDGYQRYWKSNPAAAYRERAVFHDAFPDDLTPDRIWRLAREQVQSRRSVSVAVAEALPVAATWGRHGEAT